MFYPCHRFLINYPAISSGRRRSWRGKGRKWWSIFDTHVDLLVEKLTPFVFFFFEIEDLTLVRAFVSFILEQVCFFFFFSSFSFITNRSRCFYCEVIYY